MRMQVIELADAAEALERARGVPHRAPRRAQPAAHDPRAEHRASRWAARSGSWSTGPTWSASRWSRRRAWARCSRRCPRAVCRLLAEAITHAASARGRRSRRRGRVRGPLDRVPLDRGHRDRRPAPLRARATCSRSPTATGALRLADAADRATLVEWARAFVEEAGHRARERGGGRRPRGSRAGSSGCGTTTAPVSMASASEPGRAASRGCSTCTRRPSAAAPATRPRASST